MKLTKQGLRDLGDFRPRRKPPRGMFINCAHRRMRYDACEYCKKAGRRVCFVKCLDCGFTWSFGEGTSG